MLPEFDATRLAEACTALGIRMLVLFGSRATGSPPPNQNSDLDLAVRYAPGRLHDHRRCFEDFSDVFPAESIDIAVLNTADPLFRWEIMSAGVLLWGDPDDFFEFRAFAYRDFVDSADLRALERTLSEKKLARLQETLGSTS